MLGRGCMGAISRGFAGSSKAQGKNEILCAVQKYRPLELQNCIWEGLWSPLTLWNSGLRSGRVSFFVSNNLPYFMFKTFLRPSTLCQKLIQMIVMQKTMIISQFYNNTITLLTFTWWQKFLLALTVNLSANWSLFLCFGYRGWILSSLKNMRSSRNTYMFMHEISFCLFTFVNLWKW